jgi:hypothetical protein
MGQRNDERSGAQAIEPSARWQEVSVLLTGGRADREALETGVALAQANRARLQLALSASPLSTAYLCHGYARAGIVPEFVDSDRMKILRQALATVPASMPVTARQINCGTLGAVQRLLANDHHCVVVGKTLRSRLARAVLCSSRQGRRERLVVGHHQASGSEVTSAS